MVIGQQAAECRQQRMDIRPCHPHLTARNIGQFVQNLHADHASIANDRLCTISLHGVAGREVNQDVGVEEATGHSRRLGRI
jgi:hypothetical protein